MKDCNNKIIGFSLIELLVAMAIIAILTTLAYPSYRSYIERSRRTDATAPMIQDQMILERCYAQNFSYSAACASRPVFPHTTPDGYYNINITGLSAAGYTLTATPAGAQLTDTKCASMSVNQANVKTAFDSTGTTQPECWNP